MPNYATKALEPLQNPKPKRQQYAPHRCTVPDYIIIFQMATFPNESDLIDKKHK